MGNVLSSSLMSEFPSHLHIAGYYIYGIAGPGMDAHQLVGKMEWLIPGHELSLSVNCHRKWGTAGLRRVTDKLIPSVDWKKIFRQVFSPCMGLKGPSIPGGKKYELGDCTSPAGVLLQQ